MQMSYNSPNLPLIINTIQHTGYTKPTTNKRKNKVYIHNQKINIILC